MRKKRPTIEVLKEYEQGEHRILLVKDGRDFAVIKVRTVDRVVIKDYKYGNLEQMKKLFADLVAELKNKEIEYERI